MWFVINDEADYVEVLRYDFVSSIMCSFHDENHKSKKLRFEENFPIKEELISGKRINNRNGYVKADQLFYFDKKTIDYKVIAHMDSELLDDLVQLILVLNEKGKLKQVITNLHVNSFIKKVYIYCRGVIVWIRKKIVSFLKVSLLNLGLHYPLKKL